MTLTNKKHRNLPEKELHIAAVQASLYMIQFTRQLYLNNMCKEGSRNRKVFFENAGYNAQKTSYFKKAYD